MAIMEGKIEFIMENQKKKQAKKRMMMMKKIIKKRELKKWKKNLKEI